MAEIEGGFELGLRLREAGEGELEGLVDEHFAEIDPPMTRHLFRNPFLTRQLIERIAAAPRLVSAYEVRIEIARHGRTPRIVALRFVPGLRWPDLMRIGLDSRVHPLVRRAAENRLVERLPGLAVGEKIVLARGGSQGLLRVLCTDPTPRVIDALLENPRLTEGILAPLVASESTAPVILGKIAAHRRWGVRYPIRLALCRNPSTPLERALALLPMLKKRDLEAVAGDRRLKLPVRRRAELLTRG